MTRVINHPAVVGDTSLNLPSTRPLSGRLSGGGVFDPHEVHREFPAKWQAYIQANFQCPKHVMQVFPVSDRTARKWWEGETGANGGNVAIAVLRHPEIAPAMLFAAE